MIAAPSMWTRPQIKDFKEKIRQDVDSVITVGRGEVVTVRVPTHEEGSYLFWEFATDHYDIGFGVLFEWTDSTNASVSVHVSESSDEDEDEDGERENSIGISYGNGLHVPLFLLLIQQKEPVRPRPLIIFAVPGHCETLVTEQL